MVLQVNLVDMVSVYLIIISLTRNQRELFLPQVLFVWYCIVAMTEKKEETNIIHP